MSEIRAAKLADGKPDTESSTVGEPVSEKAPSGNRCPTALLSGNQVRKPDRQTGRKNWAPNCPPPEGPPEGSQAGERPAPYRDPPRPRSAPTPHARGRKPGLQAAAPGRPVPRHHRRTPTRMTPWLLKNSPVFRQWPRAAGRAEPCRKNKRPVFRLCVLKTGPLAFNVTAQWHGECLTPSRRNRAVRTAGTQGVQS